MTSKSRTGFAIMYAGCPIIWQSKMQTITALSTTEAELIALSTGTWEVLPLIDLVREMNTNKTFRLKYERAKMHCRIFEDNSGALEIAKIPKIRPRTKHLNNRFFHFREHIECGDMSVHNIDTNDQCADMLTKPLQVDLFKWHRKTIVGW